MEWIYLSPHLDDVALSCAGLIWEQTQAGQPVSVWTICAGDPPPGPLSSFAETLHARWKTGPTAASQRRAEDARACALIGAAYRHFSVPDCIYRDPGAPRYNREEDLFGLIHPDDSALGDSLSRSLSEALPAGTQLVCPLALGSHVDHRLTRLAAEALGLPLFYYADYPYLQKEGPYFEALHQEGWDSQFFPVSAAALEAWVASILAYDSQISTFWESPQTLRGELSAYYRKESGLRLWQKPE
jgi:LmbE family N-acetylglucosaminyl deacetylase